MGKNWSSWKNEDWVSRLGDAIFNRRKGDPPTFANISSSPRVLLEICGDESSINDSDLLAALVRALARIHGDNIARAFDYSKWAPAQKFRSSSAYPQYLTLLFLTIKAASAAENSHGEGQFRDRLKVILSEADIQVANIDLSSLPKFWHALQAWNKRAIQQGDLGLRLLELPPDVGNETQIGYSKRIAFPSYRDQENLNKHFLMVNRIRAHDSPSKICSELRGSSRLSDVFRARVDDLYRRVLRNEAITHHPVMTAIDDINWEVELVQKRELGDFEVRISEIRVDDLSSFRLIGDQVARRTLSGLNVEIASVAAGEQEGVGNLMKDLSLTNLLKMVRGLGGEGTREKLARLKPFNMLTQGFLLLCKSPSLEYVSSYKVKEVDDYIVYFPLRHEIEIVQRSKSLEFELDPEVIRIGQDYRLMRLHAISRQELYKLLLCLSSTGRGLEHLASREQGVSERLFAKVNKVYLWSPITPVKFVFPGGAVPSFDVTCEEKGTVSGKLEQVDDHWVIDPRLVKELTYPSQLTVSCAVAGNHRAYKVYPLVHALPEPTSIDSSKFVDYYYANTKGGLSPAQGIFSIGSASSSTKGGGTVSSREFKSALAEQPLLAIPRAGAGEARNEALAWSTIEHLLSKFQSSKGLSWTNFRAYISTLARACDISLYSLDRLFKNSALVLTAYNYQSCGSVIVPFPRLVSVTIKDGMRFAKLTGLVSPVDLRVLEAHGFKCVQRGIENGATVFKPHVFEVAQACKVEDLLELLGANLIDEKTIPGLLAQEGDPQDLSLKTHPIDKEIEVGMEVFREGKWDRAHEGSCFGARGVYRKQTFSSTRYFVLKDGELLETRSNEWAFILFSSKDRVICEHDQLGNIRFSRSVSSLPPLFTVWWMHFGGGAIACTTEGNLLLQVQGGFGKKAHLGEFLSIDEFDGEISANKSPYIERRKLALRKKQLNKDLYYDAF